MLVSGPNRAINVGENIRTTIEIEPWQYDALVHLNREYGVDETAIIRAGLSIGLTILGIKTPYTPSAAQVADAVKELTTDAREPREPHSPGCPKDRDSEP